MRIWVVAGEYPTARRPGRGGFVRDQVVALRVAGHQVTVFHREPPSARRLAGIVAGRVAGRVTSRVTSREAGRGTTPRPSAAPAAPAARSGAGIAGDRTGAPTARSDPGTVSRTVRQLRTAARWAHDSAGVWWARQVLIRDLERALVRALREDPKTGRPDVLHAHNVFPAGMAAVAVGRRHWLPVIVTEHSTAYLRGQLTRAEVGQARRVLGQADRVIAVSPSQAGAIPGPPDQVQVVPNVVLLDAVRPRRAAAATSGTVLCIGGLTPHKGVHRLIQAYLALPEPIRAAHPLRIVGDGPQRGQLIAQATAGGLSADQVFAGFLSRTEVAAELAGAAVLVSASDTETFGVTLIEALAAGVPFVATRSGGPESIWTPECGLLVPLRDTAALQTGIHQLLSDPAQHTARADTTRRHLAEDRYGGPAIADALSQIYAQVAMRRQRAGWRSARGGKHQPT